MTIKEFARGHTAAPHGIPHDPLRLAAALRWAKTLKLGREELAFLESLIANGPDAIFGSGLQLAHSARVRQVELKIRQLADSNASWQELEPLLWQLYHAQPTGKMGARVVELAFLYGGTQDLFDVIKTLASFADDFYGEIKEEVRTYLVLRLSLEGLEFILHPYLVGGDLKKQPLELLLEFRYLYQNQESAQAFMCFQQQEAALCYAVSEFGEKLSFSLGDLLLQAGKLAVRLDYDVMARKILGRIEKADPHYLEALRLLLDLKVERDEEGLCPYGRKLHKEGDWRRRLKLFYEFLGESKRLDGMRHKGRPALNELLKDPFAWVPAIPDAWGATSKMLAAHADMELLLPQILNAYEEAALKFQAPHLEAALWSPLLTIEMVDKSREAFWRALAHFHLYMTGQTAHGEGLWDAHLLYQEAVSLAARPLPLDWATLQKSALAWVAKNPALIEIRRVTMQRELKVASDPHLLTSTDILAFIDKGHLPPFKVLRQLEQVVCEKNDPALELKLIQKKTEASHFSNRDLNRAWNLANQLNKHDYAWRLATVLHARQALHEKAIHPWAISGENRNEYAVHAVSLENVQQALKGVDGDDAKFLKAILRVGPKLPELMALLDNGAKAVKAETAKPNTREHSIEKAFAEMSWLGEGKRHYRYSYENHLVGRFAVPNFVQILPDNNWTQIMVRLGSRLGLAAANWSTTWLHQQLNNLMPRAHENRDLKIGKWLKTLSPEERNAWQDLAVLAGRIPDSRGVELFALLLTRIATMMNQTHYQALTALQTMRVPVAVIWQLENWILSEEYSQVRWKMQTQNRIPIPIVLQKTTNIVKGRG